MGLHGFQGRSSRPRLTKRSSNRWPFRIIDSGSRDAVSFSSASYNETFSVVAMPVSAEDCLPAGIHGSDAATTPSGFAQTSDSSSSLIRLASIFTNGKLLTDVIAAVRAVSCTSF